MVSKIVESLNAIRSNVWAVVLIGAGCVLILHNHESVGSSLVTGGFAVFKTTTEIPVNPQVIPEQHKE